MSKRFLSIWLPYLETEWFEKHHRDLKNVPFVLVKKERGRIVVSTASETAAKHGVFVHMSLADARAIIPSVQNFDHDPCLQEKILKRIAEWCIRFSPITSIDLPGGLMLDISGCAHLWGGEEAYLTDILDRFLKLGYHAKASIADTPGAAWGMAHFGKESIIQPGQHHAALLSLPPAALRLEPETIERLEKLGLQQLRHFINMPKPTLRRRFGSNIVKRLDQVSGNEFEPIIPIIPVCRFNERLPCLEPIISATGIEIALKRLLSLICDRLKKEEKGLRSALFKCYRMDGKVIEISIGTNRPSSNKEHLLKLFRNKIDELEPADGIELFVLEAPVVDENKASQESIWNVTGELQDSALSEFLDRMVSKLGKDHINRYLPDEHYWPERSFIKAKGIDDRTGTKWPVNNPRPLHVLQLPESIQVTAPIPDYPPMMFRYKGRLHKIRSADGPERIEQEWWLQEGQHRDYYSVEDEDGMRYWLFRLGHYDAERSYKWFMHGFFP